MRSPWQLIMWKRKQFNKGQTHFENRLGKGKVGGGGMGRFGGRKGEAAGREEEVMVAVVVVFSAWGVCVCPRLPPLRLVSGAVVKDHCPPQGRLP